MCREALNKKEANRTREEVNQGQAGGSTSRDHTSGSYTPSRNLRQLRNRKVAWSIKGNQRVKFNEVIDIVCVSGSTLSGTYSI